MQIKFEFLHDKNKIRQRLNMFENKIKKIYVNVLLKVNVYYTHKKMRV